MPSQPQNTEVIGRIAPSPTGFMHVGNARTALLAWLSARARRGRVILRIEDIDTPRVVPGAADALSDDLKALGLDWDSGPDKEDDLGPYVQSARLPLYESALATLCRARLTFGCSCSRADLARAASAPHASEEGPPYPGRCRTKPAEQVAQESAAAGKVAALRFRGGDDLTFDDGFAGRTSARVDDFVLRRADGLAAYQLAVVVDDALMGVTEVVRGDDLLSSTGRQIALHQALGFSPPQFIHVPLVVAPSGDRLAKRNRPETVRDLLARGWDPQAIVGALAASAGLCGAGQRLAPKDLLAGFSWPLVTRTPVVFNPATLESHPL